MKKIINLKSKIISTATNKKLFIYKQEFYVTLFLIVVILLSVTLASMSKEKGPDEVENLPYTATEVRNGEQVISVSIKDESESKPSEEVVESSVIAFEAEPTAEPAVSTPLESRIKFRIEKFQKLATQPLRFNVYDEQGNVLAPDFLKTVNEQKVHFVMVSENLREYINIAPTYKDNTWNVSAFMPTVGNYYVYSDIAPVLGRAVTLKRDLTVRNPSTDISYPGPTDGLTVSKDSHTVTMQIDKGPKHGQRVLSFNVVRDGGFPLSHRPFKEEFGQVSIFKHNDSNAFINLYPDKVDSSLSWMKFNPTFTSSGRYTAYATFNLGGKVVSFPFTFDINL
ncbi:hypothetical protein ACFL2V_15375 [Pseudomonadota bacterium]